MSSFTDLDLVAYLDEALPAERMAQLEEAARQDPQLVARLAEACSRRDSGMHSLGDIWRRHRLSCPSRQEWGRYLLGTLSTEEREYFEAHLELTGCRYCQANRADLERQHATEPTTTAQRRQKFFQSSAGHLRSGKK